MEKQEERKDEITLRKLVAWLHSRFVRKLNPEDIAMMTVVIRIVQRAYPNIWDCPLSKIDALTPISAEGNFLISYLLPYLTSESSEKEKREILEHILGEDEEEEIRERSLEVTDLEAIKKELEAKFDPEVIEVMMGKEESKLGQLTLLFRIAYAVGRLDEQKKQKP